MAETAPLVSVSAAPGATTELRLLTPCQAHTHARKAAEETQNVNWLEAANEHRDAATDFARASKGTNDSEVSASLQIE
jgi:hypothetical protein